jgi:exosome complex exonuclease DIS3/RRP44
LGRLGDKETENEVLLIEHDIPQILSYLPWIIFKEDLTVAVCEDFIGLCICLVDPPGCIVIDDALHSRIQSKGSALDNEAALRATTVYLVDKTIDIVSELLSSNLYSLRENVECFTFSCNREIDSKAIIISKKSVSPKRE